MANIPDFRPQQQIDPMAIVNALGEKRRAEAQLQEQKNYENQRKYQNIKDVVGSITQLTQGIIQASAAKGIQNARNLAINMLESSKDMVPLGAGESATLFNQGAVPTQPTVIDNETVVPSPFNEGGQATVKGLGRTTQSIPTAIMGTRDQQPEFMAKMQAAALRGGIKGADTEFAKKIFPEEKVESGDRYQQSQIQVPDKDGNMKTLATTFDKTSGKQLNPFTGKPITSVADTEGLLERGYAQGKVAAGYTIDGREVVRDIRSGVKSVITFDPETGKKNIEPYNGVIFQRLDNVPAGFTDSMGELAYSQKVLDRMLGTFKTTYTGPIAAKAGKMTKYVESLTKEQQVEFYGNVAEYKNSIIKAITGAQMSEVEAKRIVQQIPDENASPKAFMAGLKRAYIATNERLKAKEKALAAGGYVTRGGFANSESITEEINKKFKNIDKQTETTPQIVLPSGDAIAAELERRKKGGK